MMQKESERVIVVGAGPVGLCLSLALAQAGVEVCTIEALGEDNFLEQVPRAGTNHPATLELYERIGLYAKLEPRGIIAPLVHYWDRREHRLIAEFDHAHLKDDTKFPYVLQCERIKIVEEALALAKAHPLIQVRLSTTFTSFSQGADGVAAHVTNQDGEAETIDGAYLVSGEGARSIVRKDLDIDGSNLYTVHQRVAKKFRAGRAILAGDAAHVNSPIGAMGMNSGVHDAFNLADKLAGILRGTLAEGELDRYERQRRHVALQHTQAQTMRNKKLLTEKDPAVRARNHDEL